MYSDFHDQNGNPVSAATVIAATKEPIIKHSVGFELFYPNVASPFGNFGEDDFIRESFIVSNSCGSDGIKLGSVNIGMLKVVVKNEKVAIFQNPSALINAWLIPIYSIELDANTTASAMGCAYWVKEVEQLAEGVKLTCYDGMSKLDTPFSGALSGTPYQIITAAATACGVNIQSTQAEIEALPNGTRTFTLNDDNDCKNWRDVLSYLAQLMGCFVTFARWTYGQFVFPGLMFKPFGGGASSFCDTITDTQRYTGAKFSLWDTAYAEFTLKAYALEDPNDPDSAKKQDFTYTDTTISTEGQTIDLGYNPFLQATTPETGLTQDQIAILHDLLEKVATYQYTPLQITLPVGFIYDLGDVIKCTGRLANTGFAGGAVDDAYGVILNETYTYGRDYRIKSLDSHAGKGRKIVVPFALRDLPIGSYVKDVNTLYNGEPIIWRILEHGHTGDPEGSTTLDTRDVISLKCFDGKEPNNPLSVRQSNGNNNYRVSNLFQWLNSEATLNWYTAQHQYDAPPNENNVLSVGTPINPYDTEPGFLSNFSQTFRNAILQTTKRTTLPSDDGGEIVDVASKVFLFSMAELNTPNSAAEGTAYALYPSGSSALKVKKIGNIAAAGNSPLYNHVGDPCTWWLRTPRANNGGTVGGVNASGAIYPGGIPAYSSVFAVVPGICLPSTTPVSLEPDTDGAYILQF